MDKEALKRLVAAAAVDHYVKPGMRLGLGSGSTSALAVERVGQLYREGALPGIKAVVTSFQTEIACQRLGIPLFSLNSPEIDGVLDLAIDGADEVDPALNLTKGGGAALLPEKIVAYSSAAFVVMVDESKLVASLGKAFPVPVEVLPMARVTVTKALEALGAKCMLREALRKAGPVITDQGNLLLDIVFAGDVDPVRLEAEIALIPGVVESGFFTRIKPIVLVARADGSVSLAS
jgi:ribose 5-phosphate isomerase A